MSLSQDPWRKLVAAARAQDLTPPVVAGSLPYGLSARVLAAWRQSRLAEVYSERFGWGALTSALTVAALCVAFNYNHLRALHGEELELSVESGMESIL